MPIKTSLASSTWIVPNLGTELSIPDLDDDPIGGVPMPS